MFIQRFEMRICHPQVLWLNSNRPFERFTNHIIYEKASPFDNSNLIKYLNLSLVLVGLFFNLFFIINSNKFNVEHVAHVIISTFDPTDKYQPQIQVLERAC